MLFILYFISILTMTCHLCKKDFSRLDLHMFRMHKIKGNFHEPINLKQFLVMIDMVPSLLSNCEMIGHYKDNIFNYIEENKELPKEAEEVLNNLFNTYKREDGRKLVMKVASNSKKKHKNDVLHLQKGVQEAISTPESET